jgi:hypothetical protein
MTGATGVHLALWSDERLASGDRQAQDRRKASRSALIVSASVVGMPCGKPA